MSRNLHTKHQLSIATSLCYKQYFGCAVASSGIAYNERAGLYPSPSFGDGINLTVITTLQEVMIKKINSKNN